jgi:Tol biopolymer transport system component
MSEEIKSTSHTRRRWLVVALVVLVACGLVTVSASFLLIRNIPGVARLVYSDPADPTEVPTMRATFTPLPTATLTPTPEPVEPTDTPTSLPVGPTAPSTTSPTPQQTSDPPTAMPSDTPTLEPPTATPVPPTPTPAPQWLAFETKRGKTGDYEIFVMTPSGSRLTNVTTSWADDVAPVWSPDGRRIAFVSWRDTALGKSSLGSGSIYLMDFDPIVGVSRNPIRLTQSGDHDGWPTWSPDGKRVAFYSERSGNRDIWVINVDGSGLTQLTDHPEDDLHPAWSPDGTKIAFTSERGGNPDVWVMNADGSNPVNLTKTPGRDRYPMWSPDGAQITFNTNRDGNQEIYMMNANGSNQRNVSNSPGSKEGLADWSPDGRRLVLYSDRSGNKEIYIVNLATGKWTNITNNRVDDEFCTWSP